METAFHPLIYVIFSVSNADCYSGFRSLKSEGSKNGDPLKPREIKGLRTCVPLTGVFACIGDREGKNGDFRSKMAKLEKVRYGSNSKQKRWKALKYWGFEAR